MTRITRSRPQSIPEVQDARNLKLPYDRLLEVMQESGEARRQIEWYFNSGKTSYRVKEYVAGFVKFLRGCLNIDSGSLPDEWVIKSFGFNLDVDYSETFFLSPEEPIEIVYPNSTPTNFFPILRMCDK